MLKKAPKVREKFGNSDEDRENQFQQKQRFRVIREIAKSEGSICAEKEKSSSTAMKTEKASSSKNKDSTSSVKSQKAKEQEVAVKEKKVRKKTGGASTIRKRVDDVFSAEEDVREPKGEKAPAAKSSKKIEKNDFFKSSVELQDNNTHKSIEFSITFFNYLD